MASLEKLTNQNPAPIKFLPFIKSGTSSVNPRKIHK